MQKGPLDGIGVVEITLFQQGPVAGRRLGDLGAEVIKVEPPAGEPGDPPGQLLPGIGDEIGGLMCAWGVTAALFAREKTGQGQVVDTSLMSGLIGALAFVLAAPSIMGQEFPRQVRARAGNPLYNHYRCRDDRWPAIAHLDPDRYRPKICKALGLETLQEDPRFCTIPARGKNAAELVALLDQRFAARDRAEWLEILKREGCIFTPVQTSLEVTRDAQTWANHYFIQVNHPEWGPLTMPGFPWVFSETPASWRLPAPGLGEHTEEILAGLGFGKPAISQYRLENIIYSSKDYI